MHRRQHDASFTALNAGGTHTGHMVDVVVLTADDGLLATLQDAVGTGHALWHAPSADAAVDLLVGGRCGILIVDLQIIVRSDAAALLERLQNQFPELVLLATGRREEEGAVAGLISNGCVYRFLHKPVSPARANLFLAAATRRHQELGDSTSPALAAARQLAQPSNRIRLIAGGVAVLILAVALIWSYRDAQAPQPATTATPATTPQPSVSIDDELAAAQGALAAGRLSPPYVDNALDHYRAVLSVQADNAAARAGVQQIVDLLAAQVTAALKNRDAPAANHALMTLQGAQPQHPQLEALRAQLLALSRSAKPETPAATPKPAQRSAAIRSAPNLALARSRIASGQFIEPSADSALAHLRQARDQGEDDSASKIIATDLGAKVLDQAQQALTAGDLPQAQRLMAAAAAIDSEFELGLPDLSAVDRRITEQLAISARQAAGQQINGQVARAIKLRESGQLIEPAGSNAYDVLSSIAAENSDAPEVRAEQQRLVFALLESTRTALAAGDLDRADALTTHADRLVPGMTNTKTLQQQIAAAREQREATLRVVQAATIKRTREVPAVYPRDANLAGTEGWVDVDFTIATDGTTQDLVVRDASPQAVFDKAALEALRKWRFEPVLRNGAPVAQRATVRVRFSLN